ncbi:hypothetical protein PB2503_10024 [Parvularcula bermudensis HTCC2503]|uniref:Beta-lactamase-related domain-containing protein n=1 Tax=Parvularcula bermudensis (strain ATCC BAA-594 / HTCC2503 / KCTC 12087) TaxID=314260 RepID=E0TEW4_PARBH|nr:hypothetical protein PB2503_10024 [Parvularcula bermudensis HTCC2503]
MGTPTASGADPDGPSDDTPSPDPEPAPQPSPEPAPLEAAENEDLFAPIIAAIEASPVENLLVVFGDEDERLFAYEKGHFPEQETYLTASAAKLLSGATFFRLIEDGVMRLDDRPSAYFDYWTTDPADPRSEITLAHLLGFVSGFHSNPLLSPGCANNPLMTLQECAQKYYEDGLNGDPGGVFDYGPSHFQIAAAMAEQAMGLPYTEIFETVTAAAIGMTDTEFKSPSRQNPKAAGGATSSPVDYEKFLQALLSERFLPNLSAFAEDRTPNARFRGRPKVKSIEGSDWHYSSGAWLECDAPRFTKACAEEAVISSPGAFGWTPWIDLAHGYYGMVAMEEFGVFEQEIGEEGVRLEQELQPLIERALEELRARR